MLELLTGLLVGIVAVAMVVEPLVRRTEALPGPSPDPDEFVELEESASPKVRALLALREIEFDRATGKLSQEDYTALKERYARLALEAIDAEDQAAAAEATTDPAELAIQRMRSDRNRRCPHCGPRPEDGALFCSSCGRSLTERVTASQCGKCGARLPDGARFCNACGLALSA